MPIVSARVIRPLEVDFSDVEQRAYEVLLAEVVRIPIAALPSMTDKENWTKRLVLRLREASSLKGRGP